ncbi:MAG TPA: hypothetical protein VK674_00040 [Candidatus Limnocylindria bacterium]|nr:hypothetical protein [Candidatus Limnocylindria bacterium]
MMSSTKATVDQATLKQTATKDLEPINEVHLKPQEERHISLGRFTAKKSPKGFSIGFTPDPDPVESVVSEITSLGSPSYYELILRIANNSNRPVAAKVWQL